MSGCPTCICSRNSSARESGLYWDSTVLNGGASARALWPDRSILWHTTQCNSAISCPVSMNLTFQSWEVFWSCPHAVRESPKLKRAAYLRNITIKTFSNGICPMMWKHTKVKIKALSVNFARSRPCRLNLHGDRQRQTCKPVLSTPPRNFQRTSWGRFRRDWMDCESALPTFKDVAQQKWYGRCTLCKSLGCSVFRDQY